MRSMENGEYGKWGVWKIGSMENEEYGYKVAKKFIMKGWLTFSKRLFSFLYSALRTPIFHPTEIILFAREM